MTHACLLLGLLFHFPQAQGQTFSLRSPNGNVGISIWRDANGLLYFSADHGGSGIVRASRLGLIVDAAGSVDDLGSQMASLASTATSAHSSTYAIRGAHSVARDNYRSFTLSGTRSGYHPYCAIEVRAYDDGIAFRYAIPLTVAKIYGEATEWALPHGARLWFQSDTENYEGRYIQNDIESVAAGTDICAPITAKLSGGGGYLLLSESNLRNYSGVTFKKSASDTATLKSAFLDDPAGWSAVRGDWSPWRVLVTANDLNGLVNTDLINNLADAPDPFLFPNGQAPAWAKPGRATWSWWLDGDPLIEREKAYVDAGSGLGFEYHLVDAGWESNWGGGGDNAWNQMADLVNYAAARGVSIWVWKSWWDVSNPANDYLDLRNFLQRLRSIGVKGTKIDYMSSESQGIVSFYRAAMKYGAVNQLMVNFHGAYKPTGEERTFPNQMSREALAGSEYYRDPGSINTALPLPEQAATYPFTRLVVGPGDFCPGYFGYNLNLLDGTTWSFQLGLLVALYSPIQNFTSSPEIFDAVFPSPSVQREVLKAIPTTWDETRILERSAIGECVALARRNGATWFLVILNGSSANPLNYGPLDLSFLGPGLYNVAIVRDGGVSTEFRTDYFDAISSKTLQLSPSLLKGGGLVAVFLPVDNSPPPAPAHPSPRIARVRVTRLISGTVIVKGTTSSVLPVVRVEYRIANQLKRWEAKGGRHWRIVLKNETHRWIHVHAVDSAFVSSSWKRILIAD
ncbi:MAG: glycoside hydrolase family 97 catalytic domain-containing protein [Terrimicrobiaceae bacterium]|nr:glycoside hydrolase family 97 catalytic domain-containing protein [Terrimicrobiaceae bacterium]